MTLSWPSSIKVEHTKFKFFLSFWWILDCIEMGPPSSPVPAPPPASADAAAVRAYATTLKDLGNDRFAAGDDDSASALYGKALDACHGSMGDLRCAALCNRAACHLRAKRWRACVADCDAALALDGARAKALYRRARAAEGLGDLAAAARDYKAFLVLEPRHKDATERARKVRFRFAMRRRDAAPPSAPPASAPPPARRPPRSAALQARAGARRPRGGLRRLLRARAPRRLVARGRRRRARRAVGPRAEPKSSIRLQRARVRPPRRECLWSLRRTRWEKRTRPETSHVDLGSTELREFRSVVGTPRTSG